MKRAAIIIGAALLPFAFLSFVRMDADVTGWDYTDRFGLGLITLWLAVMSWWFTEPYE